MNQGRINVVTMPKWGLAMQEGTITGWYKSKGDHIAEGEPICDIETIKITNEFEAPFAGVIARVLAPVGTIVEVGDAIAVIVDGDVSDEEIDLFLDSQKSNAAVSDEKGSGPVARVVQIGEGHLGVLESGPAGDDTAVVFLHGFGGDRGNWGLLQAQVPPTIRTIAVDMPGHGLSDRSVGDGSPEVLAHRVNQLLDVLGVRHARIVAHSFGAAVALRLAAARPEGVVSLFLIAPVALGAQASKDFVSGFLRAERKREMKPVLEKLFSDPEMLGRTMVTEALTLLRDDDARAALSRISDHLLTNEISNLHEDRAVVDEFPTIVVWGDADMIVQMPEKLDEELNERLKVVSGSGHMPHVEYPTDVARFLMTQIG